MDAEKVTATLATPLARELMASATPARLAYTGLDGDPRVVPVAFWWNGTEVVVCTAPKAAKARAIARNPRVALTVDTAGSPPRTLLIRGAASVEVVDGVPFEYVEGSRKLESTGDFATWETNVHALFAQMARIAVRPDHVILHDFETTIPKAVADLTAARTAAH